MTQNYINHIALVLDASSSMTFSGADKQLVKVADNQIEYLAQRSKEMDQETRITVYSFADTVKCLIYDKDVLRMPSISTLYNAQGNTTLIKATLEAIEDLKLTPTKYGDHSFLIYVMTDGQENASQIPPQKLTSEINLLPDNWTLATFVPNAVAIHEAKRFGFPANNIAVWDATSKVGVEAAGKVIREATEVFMQNRTKGIRGSRNLFNLQDIDAKKVAAAGLAKLHAGQFRLLDVKIDSVIAPFIEGATKRPYRLGEAYYQLMKPEKIQPQKEVAVFNSKEHAVYLGKNARTLLGLPDYEVKVNPSAYTGLEVFIQSASVNRKLLAGTKLLLLS